MGRDTTLYFLADFLRRWDELIVDGAVHGVRDATLGASEASDVGDRRIVDGLVNLSARIVVSRHGSFAAFRPVWSRVMLPSWCSECSC